MAASPLLGFHLGTPPSPPVIHHLHSHRTQDDTAEPCISPSLRHRAQRPALAVLCRWFLQAARLEWIEGCHNCCWNLWW
ncbi:hypothetical protein M0R45_006808 [Rubus argutus]|uniref:Uncharacterized protein n=1 Tax=Rubus argutus TaxID=59490 RepID=A0AAW1YRM4_RUBAR